MIDSPRIGSFSEPAGVVHITDEFRRVMAVMEEAKEHAFITGRAGTGKSTLLRYFRANTRRRAVVLAPTGLAAMNAGGQTIHSFFRFPPGLLQGKDIRLLPQQKRLFQELDTIVIDEISMVRADVLDAVDQSLRVNRGRHETPFGGVQIIAFGDLLQLAPVVNGESQEYFSQTYETPYFFSANVLNHCDWRLMELTRNYRQEKDSAFFELLTRLGHNEMSEEDLLSLNERLLTEEAEDPHMVTLTATNGAAAAINAARLKHLPGDAVEYAASVRGEFENIAFPTEALLMLKPGAQVMLLRNDPEGRWVNGDIAIVDRCSAFELRVRLRGQIYTVEPVGWETTAYAFSAEENKLVSEVKGVFKQYPVKLAWAITIHKSQGQTLKKVVVDLGRGAFAHGQAYVALSRCESLAGLWLRRPIRPSDILFDDRVRTFMKRASR